MKLWARRAAWIAACALAGVVATGAAASAADWLGAGWTHRLPFSAKPDSIEGAGSLARVPLLVRLEGSAHAQLFAQARPDGGDLRFTSADGTTLLKAELVRFDAPAQQAQVWVRAEALSKSQNQFFLYYGNPQATAAWSADVWADYKGVYHFEGSPTSDLGDSSPWANTAMRSGDWSAAYRTDGKVGSAWIYAEGRTTYVANPGMSMTEPKWTVSGWLTHAGQSSDVVFEAAPCDFAFFARDASSLCSFGSGFCGTWLTRWDIRPRPIDEWHHYAWTYNAGTISMYYDGRPVSVFTQSGTVSPALALECSATQRVGIASPLFAGSSEDHDGLVDEWRVCTLDLSADRLRTEFRNQNAPLGFFTFGPPEALPAETSSWGGLKHQY